MDDLRRIHYVAEHYQQFQGLCLLPLALPFLLPVPLAQARTSLGLSPGVAVLLFLTAAGAIAPGVGRYYASRFGRVAPHRWHTGAATLLGLAASLAWLVWLQETRPLPVSLPLLFIGVLLARLGLAAGRLRGHSLWIAAACAAAACGPVLHLPSAVAASLTNLVIGGGIVVAALGDHHVLQRTITHPSRGAQS